MSAGGPQPELEAACKCGIARTTLQLGDLRQGRQLAMQLNNMQLFKDCALILEGLQQLTVRGQLPLRRARAGSLATMWGQPTGAASHTYG